MSKTNRWVLGFLLAVLWPSFLLLGASEPPTEEPPQGAPPAPEAFSLQRAASTASEMVRSPAFQKAASEVDSSVQAAQQEMRDPFWAPDFSNAPAASAQSAGPAISVKLEGIGMGGRDAYAVIGGEIFYEGDEKKGIKLLEVRKHEVDILVNGGKVTAPLFPSEDLARARERAQKTKSEKTLS